MPIDSTDLRLLEMLAEQRVAITTQAERWLGLSRRATAARLRRLADDRLINRQGIFKNHPDAIWITRRGLEAVRPDLPAPSRPNLASYRHDVGVGWLWQEARRGSFGTLRGVTSERHMRSADYRRDRLPEAERELEPEARPFGVGLGLPGPQGLPKRHYPDLLLETGAGNRVAVELELTVKSEDRLRRIMLGYGADPRIAAVLYLVPDDRLAQKITAAARRVGVADLVHVRRLAPEAIAGAPLVGAARQRASATRVSSEPKAPEASL